MCRHDWLTRPARLSALLGGGYITIDGIGTTSQANRLWNSQRTTRDVREPALTHPFRRSLTAWRAWVSGLGARDLSWGKLGHLCGIYALDNSYTCRS